MAPLQAWSFLFLERAHSVFIVLVRIESWWVVPLSYGFQWRGSLDVDSVFIPVLEMSWKCVPILPFMHLIWWLPPKNRWLGRIWSLSQPNMVSRGCTLAAWYFGFPQQQQWTQDSAIMKRKVATNRMSTKKAPSSSGLACGRSCSLIHTFSRISRTSSLISMLTLRRRSHKGEICFGVFLFGKGKRFTSLVNVCNFTTKASVFPLVNSSVWEEPNFVVHKNVLTMFHRPLLPLLVFTLPLSLLLSFVFLVCGACWSQAPHLISLLHFRLRPALNVWG